MNSQPDKSPRAGSLETDAEFAAYNSIGSASQDIMPIIEQLEIEDLGELSLIAWRVI
jgi:hypothetical protein